MSVAFRTRAFLAVLAFGLTVAPLDRADAAGFEIYNQGARAMGFAGAYVAQAHDPSAIYFNAAGIGLLPGQQHVYLSGGLASLKTDFTGEGPYPPVGTLEKSDNGLGILPSIYYTNRVAESLVLGLGFYRQFGVKSSWENPDEFTGRYICTECTIKAWNLNPTVAYQIEDRLAIGVGVDVLFASFDHQQRIQAEPNPFPEPTDVAELTIDASSTNVGWNVGLLAAPSESVSIGVHYRSKVGAEYDGTADFNQILTGNEIVDTVVAASLPPRQPVLITHYYPATLSGGIAIRKENWTVEGDLVYTYWSSFDSVLLAYPSQGGVPATELVQDYENVWEGRLGVEYLVSDTWAVRGGLSYDRSPQPTDTVSPFLHDEDRYVLGLGGTYRYENLELDLFARYVLFSNRSTQGLSRYGYEGLYQSSSFQVGAAIGYRF